MQVTAVDDVIVALVAALRAAVTYPVFDGPPSKRPGRGIDRYVVIGAENLDAGEEMPSDKSAEMAQVWTGLGQPARDEELHINCVAVGKGTSIAQARGFAKAAVQDTFNNLGLHPTSQTYNALVSDINAVRSRNVPGGAVVYIEFIVSASARLT